MNEPWDEIPDEIKHMLPPGLTDIGGKGMLEIDDVVVKQCADAREYCADLVGKAIELAENIKLNGATFDETWASFMVLTGRLPHMSPERMPVLMAYLLTALAFGEVHGDTGVPKLKAIRGACNDPIMKGELTMEQFTQYIVKVIDGEEQAYASEGR